MFLSRTSPPHPTFLAWWDVVYSKCKQNERCFIRGLKVHEVPLRYREVGVWCALRAWKIRRYCVFIFLSCQGSKFLLFRETGEKTYDNFMHDSAMAHIVKSWIVTSLISAFEFLQLLLVGTLEDSWCELSTFVGRLERYLKRNCRYLNTFFITYQEIFSEDTIPM